MRVLSHRAERPSHGAREPGSQGVHETPVALARGVRARRTDSRPGASPRGALALLLCARAFAVIAGRDFVVPEDVKAVAPSALAHRVTVRPELWLTDASPAAVIEEVLDTVPTPTPGETPSP